MDNKEAIKLIDYLIGMVGDDTDNDYDEAFRMAIESLQNQESEKERIIKALEKEKESISKAIGYDGFAMGKNYAYSHAIRIVKRGSE